MKREAIGDEGDERRLHKQRCNQAAKQHHKNLYILHMLDKPYVCVCVYFFFEEIKMEYILTTGLADPQHKVH